MHTSQFVNMQNVYTALDIAIRSDRNVLLYGPPGHGKSEFVAAFLRERAGVEPFVMSLSGDIDEADLFGGLDFKRLNDPENPRLFYNVRDSFLNHRYVIFEEIFDAPASVLLALKDTLTRRAFMRGRFRFPMRTKMIVGITNKDPNDIAELGDEYQALVERFPIVLRVTWESYTQDDFMCMFEKLGDVHENTPLIARLAAEAHERGIFISPRTAVWANELCIDSLEPLRFLTGFRDVFDIIEDVRETERMRQIWLQVRDDAEKLLPLESSEPERVITLVKRLRAAAARVRNTAVPDDAARERDVLAERLESKATDLIEELFS